MKQLTIQEMEQSIADGKEYLLDFFAEWCGPCKFIAPILEDMSSSLPFDIIKIDVDKESKDYLAKYNVRSIPTLIAFKNGEVLNRATGAQSKSKMIELFS